MIRPMNKITLSLLLLLCPWATLLAQDQLDSLQMKVGKYSGSYRVGLRHGKGTFAWPDGSRYDGFWRNDQMEGRGIFTSPDGTKYDGDWFVGKRHGFGTYTWANGDKYQGQWVSGRKSGLGKLTMTDGSSHEGEWINDQANGEGTHTWAGGTKYIGDWKNNQRHGQGVMLYRDGRIEQGDWAEDKYLPCKCADAMMGTADMYQKADGVFVAKVTGFQEVMGVKLAIMEVTQYWKGRLLQGRSVFLQVGMTSCDWIWFKDEQYLIYAVETSNGIFKTNRCTRTERLSRAQAELDVLAKMPCKENPKDDRVAQYGTAVIDSSPVCGCDGVTYKNPGDARRVGVRSWKLGKCASQ
jgi:hypothetical protein